MLVLDQVLRPLLILSDVFMWGEKVSVGCEKAAGAPQVVRLGGKSLNIYRSERTG